MRMLIAGMIIGSLLAFPGAIVFGQEPIVPEKPLTLADCYTLALKQSEVIAIDIERIKEAEGHFLEALGTLLPHVLFSSQDLRGEPATSLNEGSVRKFVFKQTLFQGFKEFAAVRGGRSEKDQRKYEKVRAEQLLFTDVSDAFYLYLELKGNLATLRVTEKALKDRLKELVEREKLGRSRRSEVVNTEAQLFAVVAQIELVKNEVILVRQLLEFLMGRVVVDVVDDEKLPSAMRPESEYVSKAEARSDVLAAQKARDLMKNQVIVARSGFFPTVTLENNYYVQHSTTPKDVRWDATLKIDVPIFQGTETFGAVKAARSKASQAEWEAKRVGRVANQEIKNSYARFEAALLRCQALEKALSAAEMNCIFQKEDYKLNLVNNITVLDAIEAWQTAKRNYIHGFYEAKRFFWQLRVASGEAVTGE